MPKIQNNRNKLLSLLILLLGFADFYVNCLTINAYGYIITNNHDTINSFVQVTHFDQVTGG